MTMKQTIVLMSLVSSTLAQIKATCKNIAFDSATNVLSGDCVPRNQQGYVFSELDLNDCFGYDGTEITPTRNGNFGESCSDCRFFEAPDPVYQTPVYWIGCTCDGQSDEVAVTIEVASAHIYVENKDGHLLC